MPNGQHLLGFNLRAGHNIDAIQPICGAPTSETQVQVRGEMPRYGGTGGSPAQVVCPNQSTAATPRPVVLGLWLRAEGIDGKVLNDIHLYCGIVAARQPIPNEPAAQYGAPLQDDTYGALASGQFVKSSQAKPMCPPGLIGVGVYGRSGGAVDWLGLICGAAQTGFTAERTLGKRKLPPKDDTAGHTLGKRKLPQTAGKRRDPGGSDGTSVAAAEGERAAARASVDPAIYDQYVGTYFASSGSYAVSRQANRLYLARPDKKTDLLPKSETHFEIPATGAIVRFNKSPEGQVVSLSMMFSDQEEVYWRDGHQPWPKNPF